MTKKQPLCTFGVGDRLRVKENEYTAGKGIMNEVMTVWAVLSAPCGDKNKRAIVGKLDSGWNGNKSGRVCDGE